MNHTYFYRCVLTAIALTTVSWQAYSQQTTAEVQAPALQPVTIMGNTINEIDNTLPNVDVVNLNVLRNPSVNDLRGAVNKNPAVEINSSAGGNAQQLRIRGFGQNYTELTLDGEQMPVFYNFGPYTSGGRDFVETDTLKQIDIIKGLHSPKQDNGALAGSVNLQTYDPQDFVDGEHPFYFSVKPEYTGKNNGFGAGIVTAAAKDNLSAMLMYNQRRYHDLKNKGSDATKTLRDKQNIRQQNVLIKGEMNVDNRLDVLLTGEYFNRKQEVFPRYNPKSKAYTEPTKRSRIAGEAHFTDLGWLDRADLHASMRHYDQTTKIFGTGYYRQNNAGMRFDGEKTLDSGNMQHRLLFGAAIGNDKFDYSLSGKQGTLRYLPLTTRRTLTTYVKDQMTFSGGLSVSPGVRLEHRKLSATLDDAYRRNPALPAQGGYVPHGSNTAVSPSLNVVMPLNDTMRLYGSYSRGIKQADDNNISSFDHGFGFIIPNPDLKTEKSHNYELGFSYVQPEQLEFKLTGFYNRFRDFIKYERDGVFGVTAQGTPKMIMRPFNVNKAKTYGVEVEAGYDITPQLYSHAALSWMRGRIGDEASHGVTLSQAYPQKAILGLSYKENEQWGGTVDWTVVGKGQKPDNPVKQFRTPGYGVVDVTAWWKPVKNFTLTAGVYNLTDKKYWLSADANGLNQVNRQGQRQSMDIYTQPGRNIAVNFRYEF